MVISTDKLTKNYGGNRGCRDISLDVKKGQVFGFLGHNGAGKSTYVKMLMGLIKPSSGSGEILGRNISDSQNRINIGYLPELYRYQGWLTGYQLLSFHADLLKLDRKKKKNRITEVLEVVHLRGEEKRKISQYSKGMQQRLGMASALLADPELLILDEPTSALDPIGRKEVRDILVNLKQLDKTIFLNSHLLNEIEIICDSIALIKKGELIASGNLEDLKSKRISLDIEIRENIEKFNGILRGMGKESEAQENRLIIPIKDEEEIPEIISEINLHQGKIYEVKKDMMSLEDLFMDLMEGGR